MAGLDPAIHAPRPDAGGAGKRVDARVEPGHDVFNLRRFVVERVRFRFSPARPPE
jgi:hypothetical protein